MNTIKDEKLEFELHNAIINNEFTLFYQPQFNFATSTYEGIEALIRWQHPSKGLIVPSEFISFAEESDLIVKIGEWTLRTACLQMKNWQDQGLSPIRVAVNVSGRQFKQRNFVQFVLELLAEYKLNPSTLELELNENIVIQENDKAIISMIHELSKSGILIALDDFGTGNTSIDHLYRIPVDRIKIDKTYIENIHHNPDDIEIVKSFIAIAAKLNLQIVAEGVETLKQLKMLLKHECKEIQGYYFSEPLPAEQVEKFLAASKIIK